MGIQYFPVFGHVSYNNIMKYQLPDDVKMILDKLRKAGFEAYSVGGGVRDMILGGETTDWDFTTDAKPEEIL